MEAEHASRLSALFDKHEERLYRLARRLTSSVDDALDLVQETFLKAARAPESIPRGATDEEAWLVRILVNVRRDQWRREKVRRRHDRAPSPVVHDDHPEDSFVTHTIVWKALDHLPPRRRAVVVMYELEELETTAIATILNIRPITVRWHLAQGRRQLARHLKSLLGVFDESPQQPFEARRPSPSRPTTP